MNDTNYQLYCKIMKNISESIDECINESLWPVSYDRPNIDESIMNLFNDDSHLTTEQKEGIIRDITLKIYKAETNDEKGFNILREGNKVYELFRAGVEDYCYTANIDAEPIIRLLNLRNADTFIGDFNAHYFNITDMDLWKNSMLPNYIYRQTLRGEHRELQQRREEERLNRKLEMMAAEEQAECNMRAFIENLRNSTVSVNKRGGIKNGDGDMHIDAALCNENCEQFIISEIDYPTLYKFSKCTFKEDGCIYKVCRPCRPVSSIQATGKNMNAQTIVYKITKDLLNDNSVEQVLVSIRKSYYDYCMEHDAIEIEYFYVGTMMLDTYLNKYVNNPDKLDNSKNNKDYIWNKYTRTYIQGYVDWVNNGYSYDKAAVNEALSKKIANIVIKAINENLNR